MTRNTGESRQRATTPGAVVAATVELLYFDGCPNHDAARELVERVAAEEGIRLDLRLTEISTLDEAERLRFLGSPTVRINGRDVEPGSDNRHSYMLACRIYRTDDGFAGQPSEAWIRAALTYARTHIATS